MVTGHLDRNTPTKYLGRKEQLNVNCYTLAKLWWQQTHTNPETNSGQLPGECLEVTIQGRTIKQNLEATLFVAHCAEPTIMATGNKSAGISYRHGPNTKSHETYTTSTTSLCN